MTAYKKHGYTKDHIAFICDTNFNYKHWMSIKRQQGMHTLANALRNSQPYCSRICINNIIFINRGCYTLDLKLGAMRFETGFISFSGINNAMLY